MPGFDELEIPPPFTPDLSSLSFPWDEPAPPGPAAPPSTQESSPPTAAGASSSIVLPPSEAEIPQPGAPGAAPGSPPPGAPPSSPPPVLVPPPFDSALAGAPGAPAPDLTPPAPWSVRGMPDISVTMEQPAAAPDAVTGADPKAAESPDARAARIAKQYGADPLSIPDDGDRQRYLNDLATRDPAAFAELSTRWEQERSDYIARKRKELGDADVTAARQHAEDWAHANAATDAKMNALLADAQRLADTKIDPTGGMNTGGKIAGVLGAIVGGLVQARTGSARNAGMDALNEIINRGIETQKAELANKREGIGLRRSVLGQEYARHGDMFQAQEVVRLAAYKHIDDQLATMQQQYDPRGRTGLLIAGKRAEVAGAMAQSAAATKQKTLENSWKERSAAREELATVETLRHNRAGEALDRAKLASEEANRAEARAQRGADKEAERADKEAERDRQFAIGGISRAQIGPDGKPVLGPDGKPVIIHDDLRNADGKIWRASSPEEHKALREKKTSATRLIALYDRVQALRDRVGGESATFNSDEFQELKAIGKEILLLKKSGTQGMSSDADMVNLEAAAGADDVTSFRSKAAGLRAARGRTTDQLNQEFRDSRYTGPEFSFPEPTAHRDTPTERAAKAALARPSTDQTELEFADPADARLSGGQRSQAIAERFAAAGGVLPSMRHTLEGWAADLQGTDAAKRDAAAAQLAEVANKAELEGVRSLAQRILTGNVTAGINKGGE